MSVADKINTNKSVLGKELLEWINAPKESKTPEQQIISSKLFHKYIQDRYGYKKQKIHDDVYYYVNYNDNLNHGVFLAYIVRDKERSPRRITSQLANLCIFETRESYRGSLISEWAYFQNGSSEHEYYCEGNEIITHYLEGKHPIRSKEYYFVSKTAKGNIKLFRDLSKSPRACEEDDIFLA